MAVPYHRAPRSIGDGCAAFLDVLYPRPVRQLYGALLLLDGRGEPLEFIYTCAEAPTGFLWPEPRVIEAATTAIAHSLFDACRRDPDLLIGCSTLGSAEFCRTELAPTIPFLQVTLAADHIPAGRAWINDAPGPGMRAATLFQSLLDRGFLQEPFDRLRAGLREVYPEAPGGRK
jgi:hypothetical protein